MLGESPFDCQGCREHGLGPPVGCSTGPGMEGCERLADDKQSNEPPWKRK